jgi:endonuclease/exonuclease/phosphatase family metal-dependent hydrolase
MRVMTWNVWWRFGGQWREREPRIAAALAAYAPDLIALQETWGTVEGSQPGLLAKKLGLAASVFAPTSLPPEPGTAEFPEQEGVTMGIGLVSRWPLRAVEVHDLPHEQRSGPAPTALLATVAHPAGPLHVLVTCLEYEQRYAGDQLAQATAVAHLATSARLKGPLPVLVMGDLNAYAGQPEIAPLTATLTDCWTAAGGSDQAVSLSSIHPDAPVEVVHLIDRRIDHVLALPGDGFPVRAERPCLIGNAPSGGLYPSDHWGVGVDLDLGAPGSREK